MINPLSKKMKISFLGCIVTAVTLLVVVNFTDAFQLQSIYLNSEEIQNWHEDFDSTNVINLSLEQTANTMLDKNGIYKVDLKVDLPNNIEIISNDFDAVCYMVDKNSGKIYGLDKDARLISLKNQFNDWELPIITGVAAGKLYHRINDTKIAILAGKINLLREKHNDLYRILEEIDVSNEKYLKVYPAGLPYYLKIRLEKFNYDLDRFVDFIGKYDLVLDEINQINFCCDDMVICREK